MAGVIVVLVLITIATGATIGVILRLSLAIGWEDRRTGSLRFDAPSASTRTARSLVGVSRSGWR
jgi:hypothetical protein